MTTLRHILFTVFCSSSCTGLGQCPCSPVHRRDTTDNKNRKVYIKQKNEIYAPPCIKEIQPKTKIEKVYIYNADKRNPCSLVHRRDTTESKNIKSIYTTDKRNPCSPVHRRDTTESKNRKSICTTERRNPIMTIRKRMEKKKRKKNDSALLSSFSCA